jgi:hypothetical protein
MDEEAGGEEAGFEARAVLAPARRRGNRLVIVLPVVALVGIALAGLSGPHLDRPTAELAAGTAAAASVAVEPSTPPHPAEALGLAVHQLDQIEPGRVDPDKSVAVTGWYVATAVVNCPPLAAIYRDGALPYLRGDADELAFCERSGVLYAARPDADGRLSTSSHDGTAGKVGPPAVAASLAVGIIIPAELEVIGAAATEVVVIGHFVETGTRCGLPPGCHSGLVVDHVAWTPASSR